MPCAIAEVNIEKFRKRKKGEQPVAEVKEFTTLCSCVGMPSILFRCTIVGKHYENMLFFILYNMLFAIICTTENMSCN